MKSKSKRGNNEGTITHRADGRWMARITMPDGTRQSVYAPTRAEVQVALKTKLAEAERMQGMMPGSNFTTLRQFIEVWLSGKEHSREATTVESYRYYLHHYAPELLDIAPTKLTAAHVQQLYAKRFADGLSNTTVWKTHSILHNVFDDAVKQGVLLRNPCMLVEAPKKGKHEQLTWTIAEARAFLQAIHGDRYEALFVLALSTGMRQGELLGLRWPSVDLERGWVQVRTNLQRIQHKLTIKHTKTSASTHMIYLAPFTVAALTAHSARQNEEREIMGDKWNNPHDLVFCSTIGTPVQNRNLVQRNFERAIERADVKRIRFHDLRHTTATLLLESGIHPKVVSEILGHSSVKVTMDLYAHATPAMHQGATGVMQVILQGETIMALPTSEEVQRLLPPGIALDEPPITRKGDYVTIDLPGPTAISRAMALNYARKILELCQ